MYVVFVFFFILKRKDFAILLILCLMVKKVFTPLGRRKIIPTNPKTSFAILNVTVISEPHILCYLHVFPLIWLTEWIDVFILKWFLVLIKLNSDVVLGKEWETGDVP